jgi:hypothetical protein
MEYPSPDSDSALRYREGESEEVVTDAGIWDFTSLFTPAAQLDHHGNPVANPNSNSELVVNPQTCRSQAARGAPPPPRVRSGIDLISNLFPGAQQWSAQVAPRQYYAPNVPSRSADRSRRSSLSTPVSSAPDGFHPAGPAGPVSAADWSSFPANPTSFAANSNGPVNIGSLPAFDMPQPSFNPVLPFQTDLFAQFVPSAAPGLSQLADGNSSYALSPPNLSDAFNPFNSIPQDGAFGSLNESHTPSWPNALVDGTADGHYYGRPSSTISTDSAAPSFTAPVSSPPGKRRPARRAKTPPTPLAIVQYEPPTGTDAKSSRKRPAPEEIAPQGMASHTLREVPVRNERGEVKAIMMTFGNRSKTRAVFTEKKRQDTALARRKGVCQRCKRSKRQVLVSHSRPRIPGVNLSFSVISPKRRALMLAVPSVKITGFTKTPLDTLVLR